MKTLNFIWIMLIVTSSCNKNTAEIIERTIMPVSVDEEVTAFFDIYLPSPALSQSGCFFIDNDKDIVDQKIVESSGLDLNIVLYLGENHYPAFSTFYYWGIYPKLPGKKKLNINFFKNR